nr:CYTH domain-containing protein [Dickeya solani]
MRWRRSDRPEKLAERRGAQQPSAYLPLANIYYETADAYLRQHGIGLRIRGENGRYEMTVKTAGKS